MRGSVPSLASLLGLSILSLAIAVDARAFDVWGPLPRAFVPSGRAGAAAVVDSLRHRVVVFGGQAAGGAVNSTAVLDLATLAWKDSVATTAPPPVRYDHSVVWDAPRNRLVVFGGTNGVSYLNDVWALDLTTLAWSALAPTGTPPAARAQHVAVLDRTGDRMLVLGGTDGVTTFGDLFALDLATLAWTTLAPQGTPPEARRGASAQYTAARTLVLFGGTGASTPDLADVWSLDLATLTWQMIAPQGGGPPSGRHDAADAYDSVRHALVIHGGETSASTLLGDAWIFYLYTQRWEMLGAGGPAPRANGAAVLRDASVLLIGGRTAGGPQGDVWLLDLASGAFTAVPAAGTPPTARVDHSIASDDAHERILIFGGWLGTTFNTSINETWQLAYPTAASPGFTWTQLTTTGTPTGRFGHSAVIDPQRNRMLVFAGGTPTTFASNELWSLDLATLAWTQLAPGGTPPPIRNNHAAVYDSVRQRMIVHGGFQSIPTALQDTWVYDCVANTWTQVATVPPRPAARSGHAFIHDPARDRMVITCGSAGSTYYNDTWALDYASLSWAQLVTTGDPIGRQSIPGVYDAPRDRLVVFGGYNPNAPVTISDQTWALDFGSLEWTQLAPAGEIPGGRISHAMVWNPAREWGVTWGGNKGSLLYRDGGVFYTQEAMPTAAPPPPGVASGPGSLTASTSGGGLVTFRFALPPAAAGGSPEIDVVAVDGRHVGGVPVDPALGTARWKAVARNGRHLPAGVYAARLTLGHRTIATTKIVLF